MKGYPSRYGKFEKGGMGLRKKIGIGLGLSTDQNLWFWLIEGTVEESPFSRNILNFGRG